MFLQGFCKQRLFYNLLENSDDLVLYHIHTSLEHPLHPSHAIQNAFPSPKDIKNNNLNPISSFSKRRRKNKRKGLLRIWNSRVLATARGREYFSRNPEDITPYSERYILRRFIYFIHDSENNLSLEELAEKVSDENLVLRFKARDR